MGSTSPGSGPYEEGDDARHIDWNVTARLDEPQVREFNEDRELTTWLVLDRSASMVVGGPGRGKQDVLAELALVLARVLGRNGNRVGAVLYDTGSARASSRRAPDAATRCGSDGSSTARPTPGPRPPRTSPRCSTRSRRWPGAAWSW